MINSNDENQLKITKLSKELEKYSDIVVNIRIKYGRNHYHIDLFIGIEKVLYLDVNFDKTIISLCQITDNDIITVIKSKTW